MERCNNAFFSDFLNPAEIKEIEKGAVKFGGYEGAERVMAGYFESDPDYSSFPIGIVEITHNSRFSRELSHRDYLGSILALGISRSKIGDILVEDGKAIAFLHKKILRYITDNLESVANTKVKTREISSEEVKISEKNGKIMSVNVSSLRLDAVVSAALNISRGKSASLIKSERVFLNWLETTNASHKVKPEDTITVRGSGRIKIVGVSGETKKGRIILRILKNI